MCVKELNDAKSIRTLTLNTLSVLCGLPEIMTFMTKSIKNGNTENIGSTHWPSEIMTFMNKIYQDWPHFEYW